MVFAMSGCMNHAPAGKTYLCDGLYYWSNEIYAKPKLYYFLTLNKTIALSESHILLNIEKPGNKFSIESYEDNLLKYGIGKWSVHSDTLILNVTGNPCQSEVIHPFQDKEIRLLIRDHQLISPRADKKRLKRLDRNVNRDSLSLINMLL